MSIRSYVSHGGKMVWLLLLGFVAAAAASMLFVGKTIDLRFQRDVNRMVYNDNLDVLRGIKAQEGLLTDSLRRLMTSTPGAAADQPYIVVSMADHQLWFKKGKNVLFNAPVATGSGKELAGGSEGQWRFETPRGRLAVQGKSENPAWVPPDWHYVEQARKKGLGIVHLSSGQSIPTGDGVITTSGGEVVKRLNNGQVINLGDAKEGHEIVAGGNIIVPPYGTTQRRYMGVLGTRRLELGNGYGIHGTDHPESIGQSVSHGCVRMRNGDIEKLYPMVPVGTPVYIY
ncbi:MAG: L,D-transpeptidase family protein [Gemmatimonadaceae bacterium]|nr:L,D-transpeptidase family protein [Gemmatimonadaceae bacterium]